ncbi:MAG: hypothetical protein KJ578_04020 [Bacteroidetes bacterium]|nr:hypothetical protein [Bacteroidota bacterium]MBU1581060.1 hypothetical protein [Bacteroidota bacterium]MBU2556928.1 hypothetical protein [Bacteroidota bacterium]
MTKYDINTELKLVIHKYKGDVTAHHLKNAWLTFMHLKSFTVEGYNLISDYSEGKFRMHLNELNVARAFLKGHRYMLQGKKEAIISKDPYTTAIGSLFEQYALEDAGMIVKVFNTKDAAFRWIMHCKYSCGCYQKNCKILTEKRYEEFMERNDYNR